MYTYTLSYKDWDDKEQTEKLHFNISRTDLLYHLPLLDRAEAVARNLEGPERELTTTEKRDMLEVTKDILKLAYGVKSLDGRHFRKSEEIWADFESSKAYDEYIMKLFLEPDLAQVFMTSVMPQELRDEARKAADAQSEENQPAWLKEKRNPTPKELQNMSREEMALAMQMKAAR